MSHMIETMAYTGEVPWHGLGVEVNNKMSPQQMLEAAGLDWTVAKQPLFVEGKKGKMVKVDNRFGLVRDTDSSVLGLCSHAYVPIQNEKAFDFFSKFTKAGKMQMETAGSLDGGRRIWGLARMKQGDFSLKGDDPVESYILLCQPHTPGKAMTIMYTPIRVVCHNTLTMALRGIDKKAEGVFRMSHKRDFDDDMKKLAEEVLGLSSNYAKTFKEQAQFLSGKRATETMLDQFFLDIYQSEYAEMYPTVVETAGKETAQLEFNTTVRKLKDIYHNQPGFDKSPNTWWQAFNAVTYFHDHVKGRSPESRMNVSWFGMGMRNKEKALNLALDYAQQSRKA